MLPTRPPSARKGRSNRPASDKSPSRFAQSLPAQCSNIMRSLQGLDSEEALKLLQGTQVDHPSILCRRTHLAHECKSHSLCLMYARKSLKSQPTCAICITILLDHAERLEKADQELRIQVIQAIEVSKAPQLLQFVPKLAQLASGVSQYAQMTKRISDCGGIVSRTMVCELSHENRKVVAKEPIPKDEKILFVPKECLITLEMARCLPLSKELTKGANTLKSPKHTQLAIFILYELQQGARSPFYFYLKTLPNCFDHFPINYPPKLLTELKGSCFAEMVEQKKADLQRDYETIISRDASFQRFPIERFIEVRMLVSSRVFGIVMDRVKTDAMVPLADMLNHNLPKQTTWYYCDAEKGFVIQSLKAIPMGAEVFDSYGQKCNSRFLLNYGFTLPENPQNEVTIGLSLPNMNEHGVLHTKIRLTKCLDSRPFYDLMGLLRVACQRSHRAEDSDSEEEMSMGIEALKQIPFQSDENETEVWHMLSSILQNRLREYPTTIFQDKKILNSGRKCDINMWNVVNLRLGEKQIIQFYQNMSKKMLKYLKTRIKSGQLDIYQSYLESLQF